MATHTHEGVSAALLLLIALHCRGNPPQSARPVAATQTAPAVTALERHVASASQPRAINCGVGRDPRSDATVYACGSDALARRHAFYAVFLPWPVLPSDVVSSPTQAAIAYMADDTQSLYAVTQSGADHFQSVRVWPAADTSGPMRPLRGMRLPRFSSTGGPPQQPHDTAVLEITVTADARVSDARFLKHVSAGFDQRAIALVSRSLAGPARLFGVAVPVIITVAVDGTHGGLVIRDPEPSPLLSSSSSSDSPQTMARLL